MGSTENEIHLQPDEITVLVTGFGVSFPNCDSILCAHCGARGCMSARETRSFGKQLLRSQ
jgi:ribosomal protein L40E